ncbi:MAG: hypothetical protein HYX90_00250 [Chloroflexi bacterium]|nr:hypothetical protein [Chloroflexota bacterium]
MVGWVERSETHRNGIHEIETKSTSVAASRAGKREREVWQRRFREHTIPDLADYNTVKHGLAGSPMEWEMSSFRRFIEIGFYEKD